MENNKRFMPSDLSGRSFSEEIGQFIVGATSGIVPDKDQFSDALEELPVLLIKVAKLPYKEAAAIRTRHEKVLFEGTAHQQMHTGEMVVCTVEGLKRAKSYMHNRDKNNL